jgi:hypothetical protein
MKSLIFMMECYQRHQCVESGNEQVFTLIPERSALPHEGHFQGLPASAGLVVKPRLLK